MKNCYCNDDECCFQCLDLVQEQFQQKVIRGQAGKKSVDDAIKIKEFMLGLLTVGSEKYNLIETEIAALKILREKQLF